MAGVRACCPLDAEGAGKKCSGIITLIRAADVVGFQLGWAGCGKAAHQHNSWHTALNAAQASAAGVEHPCADKAGQQLLQAAHLCRDDVDRHILQGVDDVREQPWAVGGGDVQL